MNLQMETHVGMELQKEVQQLLGTTGVEVEGAVEHTDVLDAMVVNGLQSLADGLDGQGADRFLASAYTECAGVEAASGSLQLYEGLAPREEGAFFGRGQLVELQDSGQSVVVIAVLGVEIAKSGDVAPCLGLVVAGEPMGESFFALATEDTIDKRVSA